MHVSQTLKAAAVAALLSTAAPVFADNLLVSPPPGTLQLLFEKLNGSVPDYEKLARNTQAVRNASEFTRSQKVAEETERLEALWNGLSNETTLQFNLNVSLAEYDGAKQGFPIPVFYPGTYIQGATPVLFSNAADVAIFPVTPEDGPEVLAQTGVARSVRVTITLDRLAPSPLQSNAIEGRVVEVVVTNSQGTEIGRYAPANLNDPMASQASLEPLEVGRQIADVLGVPQIGATWSDVVPFFEKQQFVSGAGRGFSGELFSFDAGVFDSQRPLEDYNHLTAVFAQSETAADIALRHSAGSFFSFGTSPRPFGALDCSTTDQLDTCGIMTFERIEGQLTLTDIVTIAESKPSFDVADVFGPEIAASLSSNQTQVGYSEAELGGAGNRPAGAQMLWAGQIARSPMPLFDPRKGFTDSYSAPVMLWTVDAGPSRTITIFRSSEN